MAPQDPTSPSDRPPIAEGRLRLRAALDAFGQSIWLDNISRELLLSGELRDWVAERGHPRRDLEPGDLREGDREDQRLRPRRARR